MYDSILTSIKKMLGIDPDEEAFDPELIMHINTFLLTLNQIGIGNENFFVESADETWDDFLGSNTNLKAVETYMYLRVRSVFDPPSSSIVQQAIDKNIDELIWRLRLAAEETKSEV